MEQSNIQHTSRRLFIAIFIIPLIFLPQICPAEQETEDVFASVVVTPNFKINIDNNYLDFGLVKPGETITLKPQTYFNTVSFISNKGKQYYVKMHILGDIIGPRGSKIPAASFKWRVYDASGSGTAATGWQEFSQEPAVVYISSATDEAGGKNTIRLQYRLDLPPSASGGRYSLKVAYLLTEEK